MNRFTYIMGANCIQEVIKHAPERILKVFLTRTREGKEEILQKLDQLHIPYEYHLKQKLTSMVQSESHQSIIAQVRQRQILELKTFLQNPPENCLTLMLDSIYDPQNFGAILRTAECFGVTAVIWSKNRGTDITPVVAKASMGATELLKLIKVSNLSDACRKMQKEGFDAIVAATNPDSQNLFDFSFPEKSLLIMGSEGKGVQPQLEKAADYSVHIPQFGKLQSLNVSNATAIQLAFWKFSKS